MNCFRRTGSPLIPPALPLKLAPSPSAYALAQARAAAPVQWRVVQHQARHGQRKPRVCRTAARNPDRLTRSPAGDGGVLFLILACPCASPYQAAHCQNSRGNALHDRGHNRDRELAGDHLIYRSYHRRGVSLKAGGKLSPAASLVSALFRNSSYNFIKIVGNGRWIDEL
jgi:hypothetical protein